MSYSLDYLLKSANLNDLFPELSNFELPDLSSGKNVWEEWKNSRLVQLIDNGFEFLDSNLDKELFDRIFQGVFNISKEEESSNNLSIENTNSVCEELKSEPANIPPPIFTNNMTPSHHLPIETITIEETKVLGQNNILSNTNTFSNNSIPNNIINNQVNTMMGLGSQPQINNQYNHLLSQVEPQNTNIVFENTQFPYINSLSSVEEQQKNTTPMSSTVAAIGRTFSSVYTAINSAQNAWNNEEENKSSAHWSNFVKKFTSFVSPGYMVTLARDSAAFFQLKLPNESITEAWKSDARYRRIYVNRTCANYGNSSKAREVSNSDKGYILDCWVSCSTSREKIRNCCSACALHWEKKGRSKKFPENNEKFVLIEASHEHVFEPDGTHQIKLRSNCSSSCQNVKGKKLELNFSLLDLVNKKEYLSTPVSIRITRSGRSFEEPLTVEFSL